MIKSHLYQQATQPRFYTPSIKTLSQAILAVTLAGISSAHASDYSSVTFFGDSLTDGGYFKPVLDKAESGQFTTNPDNTWATSFAEQLGLSSTANTIFDKKSGNNYAIGGARTGIDVEREGIPVDSVKTQLDNYLTTHRVDSKGLYTVWTGANDLFAVVDDLGNASNIISSAVGDEVEIIKKLHHNGANYIVVPNIPDVGLTPNFVNTPFASYGTSLSDQYNNGLYSGIKQTGANVIPLDTFNLLQQVAANPAVYGFSNMNELACGSVSSLECGRDDLKEAGAENSYFFADGVHPTGRAHQMIADYANAVVTAPSQVGVLPHIATQAGLATNQRLQTHINGRQSSANTKQNTGPSIWASADVNSLDAAGFDSSGNTQLLLGMDFDHAGSPDAVSGIYANMSQTELDANRRSGFNDVDLDELGVGLYHSNKLGQFQLNGAIGYGKIDMDLNRTVSLDNIKQSFKSQADGKRYYATVQAGYPMPMANMAQFSDTTVTPYLGATVNRVTLDAIREKQVTGIAMQFEEQKYNTTYGTLGIKASSRLSDRLNVFGDLHYQKQLDDNRKAVSARLNTQPDLPFTTPQSEIDDDSFGMTLGLSRQFGNINANAGVSHSSGDNDDMTSVFVGLSSSF